MVILSEVQLAEKEFVYGIGDTLTVHIIDKEFNVKEKTDITFCFLNGLRDSYTYLLTYRAHSLNKDLYVANSYNGGFCEIRGNYLRNICKRCFDATKE